MRMKVRINSRFFGAIPHSKSPVLQCFFWILTICKSENEKRLERSDEYMRTARGCKKLRSIQRWPFAPERGWRSSDDGSRFGFQRTQPSQHPAVDIGGVLIPVGNPTPVGVPSVEIIHLFKLGPGRRAIHIDLVAALGQTFRASMRRHILVGGIASASPLTVYLHNRVGSDAPPRL